MSWQTHAPARVITDAPMTAYRTNHSYIREFSVGLFVVMAVFTVAIFIWIASLTDTLLREEALSQSRSYADLIIAARTWNAELGGVYVRTSDTVQPNPHLAALGIDANDTLSDGTGVTLRNPSVMTREIGDILRDGGGITVRLTSLDPVNPDNEPDAWERAGLAELERGKSDVWSDSSKDDLRDGFRYMRVLRVDENCLQCHSAGGYRVGDVRGALSIRHPYAATQLALQQNHYRLMWIAATILGLVSAVVFSASRWLEHRLAEASRQLEHMANTDALTGLWNRRYTLTRLSQELDNARRHGHAVGVLMIDVDHFKSINDRFGHATGDEVLRRIASTLGETVRTYDVVGRVGGEELLVIAPGIDASALMALAERARSTIEGAQMCDECPEGRVTVSIGAVVSRPQHHDEDASAVIARADAAMYAAKAAGRNLVVSG